MNARDQTELKHAVLWLGLRFTAVIIVLFVVMGALVYSIVSAGTQASTSSSLASATRIDSPSDAPLGVFVAISTGG